MAEIKIENVSKTYSSKEGTVQALKNVSLTIRSGEIYGIIGMSGAGKSTLVRCMNFLEQPTSGNVLIKGRALGGLKEKELRKQREQIGMIFQHFNLLMQKSVLENVCFPMYIQGKKKKEAREKAEELLEIVGLKEKANAFPSQLSGGQKQRVAIARALANDPEILISDESTSALDPKTTKQILSLLQDLNKKLGLTVVMITHEMQIVKDICNRVAVMQNGQLLEEGSVLEIFSNPQEDLTQEFIETAAGIEDALAKINAQPLVKNLPSSALLVQLKYAGSSTDEPLLTELFKEYGVSSNILYGNVEILGDTPVGELVVVLDGEADKVLAAQKAVENAGVSLQVLKKGAQ